MLSQGGRNWQLIYSLVANKTVFTLAPWVARQHLTDPICCHISQGPKANLPRPSIVRTHPLTSSIAAVVALSPWCTLKIGSIIHAELKTATFLKKIANFVKSFASPSQQELSNLKLLRRHYDQYLNDSTCNDNIYN